MGRAAWYVTARKCAGVLIVNLFLDIHTTAETVYDDCGTLLLGKHYCVAHENARTTRRLASHRLSYLQVNMAPWGLLARVEHYMRGWHGMVRYCIGCLRFAAECEAPRL